MFVCTVQETGMSLLKLMPNEKRFEVKSYNCQQEGGEHRYVAIM